MRLLSLAACGLLLEVGWLAVWPLSSALSHSAAFTTALVQMHPVVHQIFEVTLKGARLVLPDLPDAPMTDPLGSAAYVAPVAALALVLLWLTATYIVGLGMLDRGLGADPRAVWLVIGGAVVFQLTLAYLPGLFSQDVFSYVAYGRVAAVYDLNPYIWPPSVLRDPVVPWVADSWRTYATPYGPVWVSVQWLIAKLTTELSISDQALVYRLVANGLLLANLGLAWRLLGRLSPLSRAQRTTALAALAWNPLILFEIAGNAHNDVLMICLTFVGLLLFRHSSPGILSSAAFALGTLVKYLSGPGLVWLSLASAARVPAWPRRVVRVFAIGLMATGVGIVAFLPWLELPDSLDPLLNETTGVGYINSVPDVLVLMAANRVGTPIDQARGVERVVVWAIFLVYLAWEARHVWRAPGRGSVAGALARSSLVYILLVSTSVQTWYLCLPVSVAVALGWRRRLAQITLAYAALALPALYVSYYLRAATPGWIFVVYGLGPLLLIVLDLVGRARTRSHEPPTDTVGDHEQGARGDRVPHAVMEEARR